MSSPRRDLVEAMRELNAVVGTTAVDDAAMVRATAVVAALTAELGAARLARVPRTPFAEAVGQEHYEWQGDNPVLPALAMRFADGRGVCDLPAGLGPGYEGPPGFVHGGMLAVLLDVVLSSLAQHHGVPCVTASLTVDYRAPTPLDAPLTVTARLDDVGPRKVLISGTVASGATTTVEARGVFVRIEPARA